MPLTRWIVFVFVTMAPGTATAQPAPPYAQLGLDLAYRTGYTWRGIPMHEGSSFQPGAFVGHVWSRSSLSAGIWSSYAFKVGRDRFPVTEVDFWAQYTRRVGRLDLSGGWMMYDHLPQIDSAAVQRPESTHELWLELAWPTSGITPSARVWQDVDEVRAAYCELEASIRIPIWNMVGVPMGSWTVAGRYGRTLGDSSGGSGSSRSVYRSGLEHVDLWVATTLGYIPIDRMTLAFSIEGHLVFALEDEFKAEHGPADPWLGLTLTVIGPRCRPGKDICRE